MNEDISFLKSHWNDIFKKYNLYDLMSDISSFQNESGRDLEKVISHFFKEEIYKCRGNCRDRGKKLTTPMDFFNNRGEIAKAYDYISKNKKFYNGTDIDNLLLYLRKGPGVYTHIVSNFSPRTARDIYYRYFNSLEGVNVLDTSAGFGARMSAALLTGANYYGIDPNKSLYLKLRECCDFYIKVGAVCDTQVCDIRCTGSEVFIEEWGNKMDVSFTSPPYFNYEFYSNDGFASTENLDNLRDWVRFFVLPTIYNTIYYVKSGGYIMINTSTNVNGVDLLSIWKRCLSVYSKYLDFIEIFDINSKLLANKKGITYKEPVVVFKKR